MRMFQYSMFALFLSMGTVYSQCNPYYKFKKGAQWEITNYDTGDKVASRQVNEIVSLEEHSSGWDASVKMQSYERKGKLDFEKEIEMSCNDGTISLDMSRFFPEEMMKSFKDLNMNVQTENLEVPSTLEVGKELKDASIKISGDIPFTMETKITNRKVLAKEKITTSAGSFDCYKVSYTIVTKTVMSMESFGIDWIAEDVGMVKSENFNAKGKLTGYSLLTSFK
jgi:hypothetical protein